MNRFDRLWAVFVRVTSFFLGSGIMVYETVKDHSDRPWLYAAAIGCMGLPVARAAENVLSRFGNSEQPVGEPPAIPPVVPPEAAP